MPGLERTPAKSHGQGDEKERRPAVEVDWNRADQNRLGLDRQLVALDGLESLLNHAQLESNPGGRKGEAGNRCTGGIGDVGKLLGADPEPARDGPQSSSDDEAVGQPVEKADQSEDERG